MIYMCGKAQVSSGIMPLSWVLVHTGVKCIQPLANLTDTQTLIPPEVTPAHQFLQWLPAA